MGQLQKTSRKPTRGITLITTLVALMMLVSLTLIVQSVSLANTKLLKRLVASHQDDMDMDAMHALIRPLAGDAMVNFDQEPILQVNGPTRKLRLKGRNYAISLFTEENSESPLKAQPKEIFVKAE